MSGTAGIARWDRRPIEETVVSRLTAALAHRGLDGIHVLRREGLAMVFAHTTTTPEAAFDRQPLVDASAGLYSMFDGRLDNRDELARALQIEGPLSALPDSVLAMAAYRKWGSDCAVRLLGDFSLIVWDSRRRRIFAARDVMGMRPFYYRNDRDGFTWASEQAALASGGVNEGYVAEALCNRITSCDETIHRGVMRLPMAHALVATADGQLRCWRYWRPEPDAAIRYRDIRDYEQHFRALLRDAVRARLRLAGGAALMLSGGLDSSSIAAQVREFREEGLPAADRIEAFSTVAPGHASDEGPAIRSVAEWTGLPSTCYPLEEVSESDFTADAAASLDFPCGPDILQQTARDRGLRVVFTGTGGDEWFFGGIGDLADLLRRGRLLRAASWLRDFGRVPNTPARPAALRIAAWMALPDGIKPTVRRALGRRAVPPWIDRRFAEATALEDRLRARPDDVPFYSVGASEAFWAATRADTAFHLEQGERASARDGLEERHPYYDRRLIEFALAIPSDVRCAGGIPKGLVRRALADALPPALAGMPPPMDFGFLTVAWLDAVGGNARICRSRPCIHEWVRPEVLDIMYGQMARGLTRYMWPIWAVFAADVWLNAMDARFGALKETTWQSNERSTSEATQRIPA